MNPIASATTLNYVPSRRSGTDGRRRAYLDTYAKRRGAEGVRSSAEHPDRQALLGASIPMSVEVGAPQVVEQQAPAARASHVLVKALSRRAILLSRAPNVLNSPAPAVVPVEQTPQISPQENRLEANLKALYKPSFMQEMISSSSSSAKHIRTVVASALACGVLAISIFAFVTRADTQPVIAQPIGSPVIEIESPNKQTNPRGRSLPATGTSYVAQNPTDPVRIVISSIGVNAQVQGVGITSQGLIDVPKAYGLVGWYNKGKTVGEAGPTVMVGHYASGYGAVFDKLDGIKDGDLITVTTKRGKSFTYRVTKKAQYHKDKVPMQKIFKGGDESRLEIITCQGAWQGDSYDKRLVVTAELVR